MDDTLSSNNPLAGQSEFTMASSNENLDDYWDASLIALLRRNALGDVDVLALLHIITDYLQIPEGELQRLTLFGYIWKAFNTGHVSDEFQTLKHLTYVIERTKVGYETTNEVVVAKVAANIVANRETWRTYLPE